jgi:hypothetical protein
VFIPVDYSIGWVAKIFSWMSLILIVTAGCAGLKSPEQAFLTDRITGCKIRNPYIYTSEITRQVEWSGRCYGGIAEGNGIISYYNDLGVKTAFYKTCIDSANYSCNRGGGIPSG